MGYCASLPQKSVVRTCNGNYYNLICGLREELFGTVTLPRSEMSCEPYRKKRYGPDVRWRMVFQRKVMGLSVWRTSQNLNVDQSTVRRIEKLFDHTGSVDFKSYPQSHRDGHKKLSQADEYFILQLVVEMPGIYLWEIQHEFRITNGTDVSEETIMRFLKGSGFTWKKL